MTKRILFAVLGMATALPGCATYQMPVTHLESPEALGSASIGRLDTSAMTGVDLTTAPSLMAVTDSKGNVTSTYYQAGQALFGTLGYTVNLGRGWEGGVRLSAHTPLAFRFKKQLSGPSEEKAGRGDFSIALLGGPGILLSGGGSGGGTTFFFSGDLALPMGYRVWERHLFILTPYFSFGSLSNATAVASSSSSANSISLTQVGAGLGYQYAIEGFSLRAELAYNLSATLSASGSTTQAGGLYFGGLLAFALPARTPQGEPVSP